MTTMPRHRISRSSAILVLVFVVGAIVGSHIPGPDETRVLTTASTMSGRAMPLKTDPISFAPTSPACDPVDELFIDVFAGLTDAALSNAGKDREDLRPAIVGDRELLKQYLTGLGFDFDDAELDALMGANLPGALLLPAGSTGMC